MTTLPITSIYVALFGLLFMVFTIRVGLVRVATGISFLDGGNEKLLRRMRAHGNFIETVPLALALIALTEINGASTIFVHSMAATLLAARLIHYVTLQVKPLAFTRALGMIGTMSVYLGTAGWLLYKAF